MEESLRQLVEEQMAIDGELRSAAELIARARARLRANPRHGPSYQTLRAVFTDLGRYDAAWCVCAVMSYLGCASPRERLYYQTYQPRPIGGGDRSLDREQWRRIAAPALDPRVSVITGAISGDLALVHARPLRRAKLDRKKRRDTRDDNLALSRALARAAILLGVEVPDLYLEPDQPGELSLENVVDRGRLAPSLVARGDTLRGRTPRELDCVAGCALTYLLRDFYLRVVLPTEAELRATWEALVGLAASPISRRRGSESGLGSVRSKLEKNLPARARAALALAVNGSGLCFTGFDAAGWSRAVDTTAQRIGLVACGDPAVAARTLTRDTAPARGGDIGQLLRYAVSEDYFAVREQLEGIIGESSSAQMRVAA